MSAAGEISDGGRVPHHDEHIAHSQRVRGQQVALDPQQIAAAGGKCSTVSTSNFS